MLLLFFPIYLLRRFWAVFALLLLLLLLDIIIVLYTIIGCYYWVPIFIEFPIVLPYIIAVVVFRYSIVIVPLPLLYCHRCLFYCYCIVIIVPDEKFLQIIVLL